MRCAFPPYGDGGEPNRSARSSSSARVERAGGNRSTSLDHAAASVSRAATGNPALCRAGQRQINPEIVQTPQLRIDPADLILEIAKHHQLSNVSRALRFDSLELNPKFLEDFGANCRIQ